MTGSFSRTELFFGREGMERLWSSRVAVFGIGGVGGFAAEALARSGIGRLELIDSDTVAESNLNRQIIALHSTVGRPKVEVMRERIRDISPETEVTARQCLFLPETAEDFDFGRYDYVIDAIDNITGKIEIVLRAQAAGVPVISAMGAGNKLDPTALKTADIYSTSVCPLARVMRRELKKRGVKRLKVVYSEEPPISANAEEQTHAGRSVPASNAFVPSVMGLIIAGEVIKELAARG
ncbi:MAG: tRNA threonylcarbamoyladenosine dehydratase [Ruminococcus sp.]|nr:tRNA threonylcarbamoyladenosine dehydratase [Ruminococcus sp.]